MAILDYMGRPVSTSELTKEIATTSLASIRTPFYPSMASGLTPERLGAIVAAVDQNDILEYLTLAEEMEERDLHYHSVLSTRKLAVSSLEVAVEACSDDAQDVEIADYVREVCQAQEFKALVSDQLDALGKGFAVSEIMWDRSGKRWEPAAYLCRDQRHFQFDRLTGCELRLRDPANFVDGLPLAPYKFVQHRPRLKTGLPIRGGLARLAVVAFMCKSYALKDWLAFAEVFGMPLRLGKYSQSAATPDQKKELLRAVANIGTDAAAIIPDTMMIDFVQTSNNTGGDRLFQGLADWLDSQVSKGVLGQTMTSDNGSSLSQAEVHDRVRSDIKDNDADQLAVTLCRDVVRPLVDLNFGPRPSRKYPLLRLVLEEPDDLESLAKSLPPFIDRGLPVEVSVILDKFGLPLPDDGAQLLGTASPAALEERTEVPEEAQLHQLRRKAVATLMHKVVAGETLTEDQRRFLATAAADHDDIDRLADEALDDWQAVIDPMVEPLAALARRSASFEEFLRELPSLQLSPDELQRVVAVLTFKARGLGDATDKL